MNEFDISHGRFQNEFSELSVPRSCPKRVTVPSLECEEHGLVERFDIPFSAFRSRAAEFALTSVASAGVYGNS